MENKSFNLTVILTSLLIVSLVLFIIPLFGKAGPSKTAMIDLAKAKVNQVTIKLENFISEMQLVIKLISKDDAIQQAVGNMIEYKDTTEKTPIDPKKMSNEELRLNNLFKEVIELNPMYKSVYFADTTGGFTMYPHRIRRAAYYPPERGWYRLAESNQDDVQFVGTELSTDGITMDVGISLAIHNSDGEFIGVLGTETTLNRISAMLESEKIGKAGYMIITDDRELMLANPIDVAMNFKPLSRLDAYSELLSTPNEITIDGIQYLVIYNTSKQLGYHIWGLLPVSELEEISLLPSWIYIIVYSLFFIIILITAVSPKKDRR